VLVLTRKPGETIRIGSEVRVTLVSCVGGQARIAIEAPRSIGILREELYEQTAVANLAAAMTSPCVMGSAAASAPARGGVVKKGGGK